MALATFLPATGFAVAWAALGGGATATVVLGLLAAACGLLTVASQAMIYASLKPVRQWHNAAVLPNFLLLAAFSGVACIAAMAMFWQPGAARIAAALGVLGGVAALAAKLSYWRRIDRSQPVATIESATGLGFLGAVRSLELPHTEENYLLREMGFAVGRKHARRLRRIAVTVGFAAPIVLLAVGLLGAGALLLPLAAAAALTGIYVERWLFFAEATHTVTLYYGRPS